jgi:Uma2 family endonuclease
MSIALQEPEVRPRTDAPAAPEAMPEPPLYRLSVEQYLAMVRLNILTGADRVELLEGVLVAKMSKNPLHIFVGKRIFAALAAALPAGWHVSKEDPVRGVDSVPEPDCAVLRGADSDYLDRIPARGDLGLVVEVTDSSLSRDRNAKLRAYARAGIPYYWIINLADFRVEVYSDPTGPIKKPTYRVGWAYGRGEQLPLVIDGLRVAGIAVSNLFP